MIYEELLQGMLDRVPSNVDKREGSVIYDALAPSAFFLAQQHYQLDNFVDLIFPDTALGEYLDRAAAPFGITRKAATPARRIMTVSANVEIGTKWGINGLVYIVMTKLTEGEYEVKCETLGELGNLYSGAMQPISNISGVSAELKDIISPGMDEEADKALRERLFQKVRLPVTSGNAYHYKLWALEVTGVGDAKIFPLDNGPGTVTILIVDNQKEVDRSLESGVSAYIETVRPIGASVTISSPNTVAINVMADVTLDGSRTEDEVLGDFKKALNSYLKEMVFLDYRISYARVGSLLLTIEGVQDYKDLTLNGTMANVMIGDKEIPVIGTVIFSEVRTIGTD